MPLPPLMFSLPQAANGQPMPAMYSSPYGAPMGMPFMMPQVQMFYPLGQANHAAAQVQARPAAPQAQQMQAPSAAMAAPAPLTDQRPAPPPQAAETLAKAEPAPTRRSKQSRMERATQVHVSQVSSKFNPAPAAGNRDCGPASVVMALGLLGLEVPGSSGSSSPQAQMDRVREIIFGKTISGALRRLLTSNSQLDKVLEKAGATSTETKDWPEIQRAVEAGNPVILHGNPGGGGTWQDRLGSGKVAPYNGGHWIVVSGYNPKNGKYVINDPLSKVGAIAVTTDELNRYKRTGGLGIIVEKD